MVHNLTGKDKSARIPLPYHQQVGRSRKKWAIGAGVILLLAAVGFGATGYWKEWSAPMRPVHSSHAAWENDCSSCHAPLKPTNSGNALSGMLSDRGKVSDKLCTACHMGQEGQQHHANMTDNVPEMVATCAACHKEHQGRSAFISRVSDAKCTCCHADLTKHVKGTSSGYHATITSFEGDAEKGHPPFSVGTGRDRALLGKAKDPGKLRFNHKMHLAEGIVGGSWTFERITDDKMRDRLMKLQGVTDPKKLVNLGADQTCSACHVLSASDDPGRKVGPARPTGEYILPATYDQHCKGCHPLTFSPTKELANVEIPHHLQPGQVSEFLSGVFARTAVKADSSVPKIKKIFDEFPLPGDNLKREERLRTEIKQAGDLGWAEQARRAKDVTTCVLCHYEETIPGKKKGDPASTRIVPVDVPEIWFPHAKFSHEAHRAVRCADCHGDKPNESGKSEFESKYGLKPVYESVDASDVLLPLRNNCLECHSSARTEGGKKLGGVRHECVTCHNYHHSDEPRAGLGVAARGVKERVSIEKLLSPAKK